MSFRKKCCFSLPFQYLQYGVEKVFLGSDFSNRLLEEGWGGGANAGKFGYDQGTGLPLTSLEQFFYLVYQTHLGVQEV